MKESPSHHIPVSTPGGAKELSDKQLPASSMLFSTFFARSGNAEGTARRRRALRADSPVNKSEQPTRARPVSSANRAALDRIATDGIL